MFSRRINARNARMYRHYVIIGINKARAEFQYGTYLPSTPAIWKMGEAPISETITMMDVEAKAYRSEKRKRGWVSKPKPYNADDRKNNNVAIHVAAIAGLF